MTRKIFNRMPCSDSHIFNPPNNGQEVSVYPDKDESNYWVIVGYEKNKFGHDQIFHNRCFSDPVSVMSELIKEIVKNPEYVPEEQVVEAEKSDPRIFTLDAPF